MTLLIACLLIYNFGMPGAWYVLATLIWVAHIGWNALNK